MSDFISQSDDRQPSVREARSIRQHHAAERELALRAEATTVTEGER